MRGQPTPTPTSASPSAPGRLECAPSCPVRVTNPVSCANGVSYDNACVTGCGQTGCQPVCPCPTFDPVRCSDRKICFNTCRAACRPDRLRWQHCLYLLRMSWIPYFARTENHAMCFAGGAGQTAAMRRAGGRTITTTMTTTTATTITMIIRMITPVTKAVEGWSPPPLIEWRVTRAKASQLRRLAIAHSFTFPEKNGNLNS